MSRSKGGKGKAIIKRSKSEAPVRQEEAAPGSPRSENRQPPEGAEAHSERDAEMTAKIQQRAYRLFEARGREHGHDLEHWLEAEREITGSSDRSDG